MVGRRPSAADFRDFAPFLGAGKRTGDAIEQHWKSVKMGELVEGAEMVSTMKRVK